MPFAVSRKNLRSIRRWAFRALYLVSILLICAAVLDGYRRYYGYSWMPQIGALNHHKRTAEFDSTVHYIHRESYGYDGQYYAELSLFPGAEDEGLQRSLDNFTYRARRILFSWTAFLFGLGQPDWIIQAYSIQNLVFWLLLAILLLRWFPPDGWQNALRYLAMLTTVGLAHSIHFALLAGPSLLLIALGAHFLQGGRRALGILSLGLAGLAKETNLLAAAGLPLPKRWQRTATARYILQVLLVVLPFALWYGYLIVIVAATPSANSPGEGHFDWPFVGALGGLASALKEGGETGFPSRVLWRMAVIFSLLAQAAYFILRPKPRLLWWRIGFAYALLLILLGESVWEGPVGAASSVVLPLTLAFNVLFPRRIWLLPVLVFVNLPSVAGLQQLLAPPPVQESYVDGPASLVFDDREHEFVVFEFVEDGDWHPLIEEGLHHRRWCAGEGSIRISNPHQETLQAEFTFTLKVLSPRPVIIEVNGEEQWRHEVEPLYTEGLSPLLVLPPGENRITIRSPGPPDRAPGDPRPLAFALHDFSLRLVGKSPAGAGQAD